MTLVHVLYYDRRTAGERAMGPNLVDVASSSAAFSRNRITWKQVDFMYDVEYDYNN